ncbi:hypothetical protein LY78DRAFT_327853 [Colletotrichum sublineola]|nr:hypothetical protein LY78DRAFT_327853 [Colletotrichum sublineola]
MDYQVDVFHNLHCLTRLRERFLANDTSSSDMHSLHCFNRLRQSLMCNADLMLGVTEDYEDYGILEKHTCKDFDAVVDWAERNSWKNFLQWTYQNNRQSQKDESAGKTARRDGPRRRENPGG